MRDPEEISSTEKLLDLIRGHRAAAEELSAVTSGLSPTKKHKLFRGLSRPGGKRISVGVELGFGRLRLVKVQPSATGGWQFRGDREIVYDSEIPLESRRFTRILTDLLAEFCGPPGKVELWALLPEARAAIRQLRIPKFPMKQFFEALHQAFKKEVPFDEKEDILDFEILGDVTEDGVQKRVLTAYKASKAKVELLRKIFADSGYRLSGISPAPFAIQNLLRTGSIESAAETICVLSVGEEWSRIDIFDAGNLALSRDVKTGMNSLVRSIIIGLERAQTAEAGLLDASPGPVMEENHALSFEQGRKVLSRLIEDSPPLAETEPGASLKRGEVFRLVRPAIERLVWQVERSFEHYALNGGGESVSRIFVTGEIIPFRGLINYLSEQVGLPYTLIDPLAPGMPSADGFSASRHGVERAAFATAAGIALSNDNRTPNLLCNCLDKHMKQRAKKINRNILAVILPLTALCMGTLLWQAGLDGQKNAEITALKKELRQYTPRVDRNLLVAEVAMAVEERRRLRDYSRRYLAMAVVGELSRVTPPNIRLLNMTAELGAVATEGGRGKPKTIVMEGVIAGEPERFEAELAAYLMSLSGVPLFSEPTVSEKTVESFGGEKVFRFTARMNMNVS